MVTVQFLGPIPKDDIQLDVSSLTELSDKLKQDPQLLEWLEKCAVAINDEVVTDKSLKLKDGDTISLLPPVCGG